MLIKCCHQTEPLSKQWSSPLSVKVQAENEMKTKTVRFLSVVLYWRANVSAEIVVAMVIKVINSAHGLGEERGVMC